MAAPAIKLRKLTGSADSAPVSLSITQPISITLNEYSMNTCLDINWLVGLGVKESKDSDGRSFVRIPMLVDGKRAKIDIYKNQRAADGAQKYMFCDSLLDDAIREAGWVIITRDVESTLALLQSGLPAVGALGKDFPAAWGTRLAGLQVYAYDTDAKWIEQVKTALRVNGTDKDGKAAELSILNIGKTGAKTLHNLYIAVKLHNGGDYEKTVMDLVDHAAPVDLAEGVPVSAIEDLPIQLVIPKGYELRDDGVYGPDREGDVVRLLSQPLIIRRVLQSIETEDYLLEIQFRRRGKWCSVMKTQDVFFNRQSLLGIAKYGLAVGSKNATEVAGYLMDLHDENADLLPEALATKTLGWKETLTGKQVFLPFSETDEVFLNLSGENKDKVKGLKAAGDYQEWLDFMDPFREDDRFRFTMAASFASPLLKICEVRNFVIYQWGSSRSGKTAQQKGAVSVWGDPNSLKISYDISPVGLERFAELYNGVPFVLDEQEEGEDQTKGRRGINKIDPVQAVYKLANGTGKGRGTKDGGTDRLARWQTVVLSSGEVHIIQESTSDGFTNRIIELRDGSLTGQEDAARVMHNMHTYGHAGPEFIEGLMKTDWEQLKERWETIRDNLMETVPGLKGTHAEEIAVVVLADYLSQRWIWSREVEPGVLDADNRDWNRAMMMGIEVAKQQVQASPGTTDERSAKFIADWLQENQAHFKGATMLRVAEEDDAGYPVNDKLEECRRSDEHIQTVYGEWPYENTQFLCGILTRQDVVYVIPRSLKQALAGAGFEWRKATDFLKMSGIAQTDGAGRLDKMVRVDRGAKPVRRIVLRVDRLNEVIDKIQ